MVLRGFGSPPGNPRLERRRGLELTLESRAGPPLASVQRSPGFMDTGTENTGQVHPSHGPQVNVSPCVRFWLLALHTPGTERYQAW